MNLDRFTTKSRGALEAATSLAAARNHTETTPEHLLAVLLEQEDGIVVPVLNKLGARPEAIRGDVNAALDKLPTIQGAATEPTISRELVAVLRAAERELGQFQDEYVSTEHLLLSLAAHGSPAGEALRRNGARKEDVVAAIQAVRGPHRVTDENPEDKYQSLEKFGRDLTQAAAGRQARPRHRPRRRDPPRHPGPRPPHEEQPRPDRRARRRQDRDRRGPRPAHRLRRRARAAAGTAASSRSTSAR